MRPSWTCSSQTAQPLLNQCLKQNKIILYNYCAPVQGANGISLLTVNLIENVILPTIYSVFVFSAESFRNIYRYFVRKPVPKYQEQSNMC